jgi:hypothetical protein
MQGGVLPRWALHRACFVFLPIPLSWRLWQCVSWMHRSCEVVVTLLTSLLVLHVNFRCFKCWCGFSAGILTAVVVQQITRYGIASFILIAAALFDPSAELYREITYLCVECKDSTVSHVVFCRSCSFLLEDTSFSPSSRWHDALVPLCYLFSICGSLCLQDFSDRPSECGGL